MLESNEVRPEYYSMSEGIINHIMKNVQRDIYQSLLFDILQGGYEGIITPDPAKKSETLYNKYEIVFDEYGRYYDLEYIGSLEL